MRTCRRRPASKTACNKNCRQPNTGGSSDHFARNIAEDLRQYGSSRALYVATPGGEQAFVEGFRELLITALVAQGLPVSTEARDALSVDVRYSIYRFSPERAQRTYYYGEATALSVPPRR